MNKVKEGLVKLGTMGSHDNNSNEKPCKLKALRYRWPY